MRKIEPELETSEVSETGVTRRTIFAFVVFLILGGGAWWGFTKMYQQPKMAAGTTAPLRKVLDANERISIAGFNANKLAKEYPASAAAKRVRVNGMDGLRSPLDTTAWRLNVIKGPGDTLHLTMDDIKKLPKKDLVFDFKCIEGWNQVTHWGGVPLKTFMERYGLTNLEQLKYMGLATPDKKYYVGIDMPSALHPQTILCYEMNGQPLPLNQGYPLRLIIPVKYGIKHLKRIGTMYFSDEKPPDFWAERGYDYYAGH